MTTIIILIVLLALAIGAFFFIVNSVINKSCPTCGPEQLVIPIVPGFFAWCPQCGDSFRQQELITSEEQLPLVADDQILDQQPFVDNTPGAGQPFFSADPAGTPEQDVDNISPEEFSADQSWPPGQFADNDPQFIDNIADDDNIEPDSPVPPRF